MGTDKICRNLRHLRSFTFIRVEILVNLTAEKGFEATYQSFPFAPSI